MYIHTWITDVKSEDQGALFVQYFLAFDYFEKNQQKDHFAARLKSTVAKTKFRIRNDQSRVARRYVFSYQKSKFWYIFEAFEMQKFGVFGGRLVLLIAT
jgi:hypothetical protein